jgi:hypothetical protein
VEDPYNGVEIAIVGKIIGLFSPTVLPFTARNLWFLLWEWRNLALQVGTSKA